MASLWTSDRFQPRHVAPCPTAAGHVPGRGKLVWEGRVGRVAGGPGLRSAAGGPRLGSAPGTERLPRPSPAGTGVARARVPSSGVRGDPRCKCFFSLGCTVISSRYVCKMPFYDRFCNISGNSWICHVPRLWCGRSVFSFFFFFFNRLR